MDTDIDINLDALIAPISAENPSGNNLRNDISANSLYYQIKDARNHARSIERQLVQGGDASLLSPIADWKKVLNLSVDILSTKSKDLEICAWFIESLIRIQQFEGLRKGFYVTQQLVEQFWETLYPLPEENDISMRVAALGGLNGDESEGTLIAPIDNVPLISSKTYGDFSFWQYQQASDVNKIQDPEKKAKRIADGVTDFATIELAIKETSAGFFVNLINSLNNCLTEFATLHKILDSKCGSESPPASQIRDALTHYLDIVKYISQDILALTVVGDSQNPETGLQTDKSQHQGIDDRHQALATLNSIADFFRRTEPHSPLPYLIEKVIRWGNMPLPDLLMELIPDQNAQTYLFNLAGIQKKNQND